MTDKRNEKRLLDLERRLKRLENETSKAGYCHFLGQQSEEEIKQIHLFNYKFEVHSFTYLKLSVKIETQCQEYDVTVKVNGSTGYKGVCVGTAEIDCVLPFSKGVNDIQIMLKNIDGFTVEKCVLETCGNISYLEVGSLLQVINESDKSIILSLVDGKVRLSEYKDGISQVKYKENDIKSASICKLGENYLLTLAYLSGIAKLLLFNSSIVKTEIAILEREIMSVCSLSGVKAKVFAVKGNSVYKYVVNDDLTYEKYYTGLKGKEVKCNPKIDGYIIVVDYNGEAKLVRL